ncbi:MAG TPA: methylmalonyl Co-A mutase-associated GTPase MeaB [Hyphomicrobiaceae bacterium]|nr:methylmalonyl Co-A mutase-associated GTPase MeaB [Hyphomicrobiaceae bacterium]
MTESQSRREISQLLERMRTRERPAVARAVTLLETLQAGALDLLSLMQPYLGHAQVVGLTGPPGAGKSTLVNAYIRHARACAKTVGVIAVDPSSPVSGGAILGDRIRMTAASDDDGVFVRSLASRGHLGGLSPAAVRIIDVLDAAGFDLILIETVGTGQSEVDIAEVADVRVVVAAPGLGDDIQAMKSGVLEIADVVVVNKADVAGANRTAAELSAALSLRAGPVSDTPIVKTVATSGSGIGELAGIIDRIGAMRMAQAPLVRRRRRARYLIARAAADLIAARIRHGAAAGIDALSDAVLEGRVAPADAAAALLAAEAETPAG